MPNHESAVLLTTTSSSSVLQAIGSRTRTTIVYLPYGRHSAATPINTVSGFNGQHCEHPTEHYLLGNGYRAYNPVLMCFNSPDHFSPFGDGGLNTYTYTSNDPINNFDPSGHWKVRHLYPWLKARKPEYSSIHGVPTNKIQLTNARILGENIMVYDEFYQAGRGLVVHSDGFPGVIGAQSGKPPISAKELYDLMKTNKINLKKYEHIRVFACYSGSALNTGGESFAQTLANLTKLNVKGYKNVVANRGYSANQDAIFLRSLANVKGVSPAALKQRQVLEILKIRAKDIRKFPENSGYEVYSRKTFYPTQR